MIDINKLYITNYSHPNCTPLQNIMRLPKEEAFRKAAELAEANKDTTAFYRFADFVNYYPCRLETDRMLYERFVKLGGKPVEKHPLSFVLGESEYLKEWFGNGTITKISLADIPTDSISFVYGDSMSTLARTEDFEMITKEMLAERPATYEGNVSEFMKEIEDTCYYIEVQLWDDGLLF